MAIQDWLSSAITGVKKFAVGGFTSIGAKGAEVAAPSVSKAIDNVSGRVAQAAVKQTANNFLSGFGVEQQKVGTSFFNPSTSGFGLSAFVADATKAIITKSTPSKASSVLDPLTNVFKKVGTMTSGIGVNMFSKAADVFKNGVSKTTDIFNTVVFPQLQNVIGEKINAGFTNLWDNIFPKDNMKDYTNVTLDTSSPFTQAESTPGLDAVWGVLKGLSDTVNGQSVAINDSPGTSAGLQQPSSIMGASAPTNTLMSLLPFGVIAILAYNVLKKKGK